MKAEDIYAELKLTEEEVDLVESYVESDNDGCFMETEAYTKLLWYFCSTGEMPYGVAKARTGDPDLWILEHLGNL